jgi:hypothetical protein
MSDNRSSVVNLLHPTALAPRTGADDGRMARRRGVQSLAQAYVFNVFDWLAEAAHG